MKKPYKAPNVVSMPGAKAFQRIQARADRPITLDDVRPDWTRKCKTCAERPIVPFTELCGVCTFGDQECANGNW